VSETAVRRGRRFAPVGTGFAWLALQLLRWSGSKTGLALAYHRLDLGEGSRGRGFVPTMSARLFESQVRHLKTCYRVVRASELLPSVAARRRGERFPVAITFDDDQRSHLQVAMPILRQVGVPATFFVCGASLDRPFSFWWERLETAIDRGATIEQLVEVVRPHGGSSVSEQRSGGLERIVSTIRKLQASERDAVAAHLSDLAGPDPSTAGIRAEGLRDLAAAGFEIGFHTLRHDSLTQLDDDSLAQAMLEGRDRVTRTVGRELTTIAYPHGKADARVAAAARAAGYRFGFTSRGKSVPSPEIDPLLIGRVDPRLTSVSDFALDLARVIFAQTRLGQVQRWLRKLPLRGKRVWRERLGGSR
jgi:peptidoglycan/xylan/chitin deacetylase (PgdA/CDA1 family)